MSSHSLYVSAQGEPVRKAKHSRHHSAASPATIEHTKSANQPISKAAAPSSKRIHYTCLIRLPFSRDSFEDPAPAQWDSNKDKALWKLISQASNSRDLDWEEISLRFDVPLAFLLQQAAWLYERHFEGMKAQMKKFGSVQAGAGGISQTGQAEGSVGSTMASGGVPMQKTRSKDPRIPIPLLATTSNRDVAGLSSPVEASNSPATPRTMAPPISRTPSTATVTQSKIQPSSSIRSQPIQRALRGSGGSDRKPNMQHARQPNELSHDGNVVQEHPINSDSEEEPPLHARSRLLRRTAAPKRPQHHGSGTFESDADAEGDDHQDADDDDDEDEESGGYLPFAAASGRIAKADPSATIRGPQTKPTSNPSQALSLDENRTGVKSKHPAAVAAEASPASSESSAMHRQYSNSGPEGAEFVQRPGPLSPRQRAQLASLSPRTRREGSEGSPSMGSSFSDLDDASVTQSALEDALLSNMRQGNFSSMASRMSSLREALGK